MHINFKSSHLHTFLFRFSSYKFWL